MMLRIRPMCDNSEKSVIVGRGPHVARNMDVRCRHSEVLYYFITRLIGSRQYPRSNSISRLRDKADGVEANRRDEFAKRLAFDLDKRNTITEHPFDEVLFHDATVERTCTFENLC